MFVYLGNVNITGAQYLYQIPIVYERAQQLFYRCRADEQEEEEENI